MESLNFTWHIFLLCVWFWVFLFLKTVFAFLYIFILTSPLLKLLYFLQRIAFRSTKMLEPLSWTPFRFRCFQKSWPSAHWWQAWKPGSQLHSFVRNFPTLNVPMPANWNTPALQGHCAHCFSPWMQSLMGTKNAAGGGAFHVPAHLPIHTHHQNSSRWKMVVLYYLLAAVSWARGVTKLAHELGPWTHWEKIRHPLEWGRRSLPCHRNLEFLPLGTVTLFIDV